METDPRSLSLIEKTGYVINKYGASFINGIVALVEGLATNNPNKTSEGICELGLGGLHFAVDGLIQEKRTVNIDKSGLGIPMKIAMKWSQKGSALRGKWMELLKNSIDGDFPHDIRDSDIDLADTLAPSDFLNIMSIYNHKVDITTRYNVAVRAFYNNVSQRADFSILQNSLKYGLTDCRQIKLMAATVLGAMVTVPEDELGYSFLLRGIEARADALFDVSILQEINSNMVTIYGAKDIRAHAPIKIPISDFTDMPEARGQLVSAELTHQAQRICRLFNKYGA